MTTPYAGSLRVSDTDRERARAALIQAYAEGRLRTVELEERAASTFAAVTRADLDELVADLVPRGPDVGPDVGPDLGPDVGADRDWLQEASIAVALSVAAIVLWLLTGRGFFWPLWMIVYAGMPTAVRAWRRARSSSAAVVQVRSPARSRPRPPSNARCGSAATAVTASAKSRSRPES